MPQVVFTPNLQRHITCHAQTVAGTTVKEVLEQVFRTQKQVQSYILNDQGEVRKHIVIFIDGRQMNDRISLSDPVNANSEIYIMQALSGG